MSTDMLFTAENCAGKWAFEVPPAPIPPEKILSRGEAGLIVVGEGFAGLSAATAAAENGLDTLIVTGSSGPVGRGGSVYASYSKVMERLGYPRREPGDFYLEEFASSSFCVDQRKWYRFYNESEEAMNWLIDIVEAAGFQVVLEDANRDDEASPTFQPPGTHGFLGDGSTFAGIGIRFALKALEDRFKGLGGRVLYKTPACRLVQDAAGRVTGVIVRTGEDEYAEYASRSGVILATGDFSANRDMMARYCPTYAKYFNRGGNDYSVGFAEGGLYKGEGHRMALWAGAAWQRTFPNAALIQGSRLCSNMPYGSHRGLRLNIRGERFMNEDSNGAYTAMSVLRQPGETGWAVWGENYAEDIPWRRHGGYRDSPEMTPEEVRALWQFGIDKGFILVRDSIEELVDAMGVPKETALREIARYNELCRAGYDADFHKKPKYLQEIKGGRYYAGQLNEIRFFSVLGGPRTDHRMRICNENDEPIPGLYAVGSMVGDMFAGCYNFRIAGHNYGCCLTFGYQTGKAIALAAK